MQVTGKVRSASLPTLLMLINGVFWLFFAANFVMVSQAYQPHVKHFEEESPPYIFWGHALPFKQFTAPFVRVTHLVEMPSFYTAAPFNFYCSHKGIVVDDLYLGVSEGGYYLILVFLISFLQWCLVGMLMHFVIRHLRRDRAVGGKTR